MEEPTRSDGDGGASGEQIPLAERHWRHPWSHRHIEQREVPEG